MASFLEKQIEAKAAKIKAFIEKGCEERDIELDEILVYTSFTTGSITVYLEDGSYFDLGRIGTMVKMQWPDIEVIEPEVDYELEIQFSVS